MKRQCEPWAYATSLPLLGVLAGLLKRLGRFISSPSSRLQGKNISLGPVSLKCLKLPIDLENLSSACNGLYK